MTETVFLFHSTVGVIKMRKALQAAGIRFRVADIPRQLRGSCGLCIYMDCAADEETQWVIPGYTESIYRCEEGEWCCIAAFAAADS